MNRLPICILKIHIIVRTVKTFGRPSTVLFPSPAPPRKLEMYWFSLVHVTKRERLFLFSYRLQKWISKARSSALHI